jgi:uncharacterized coiled-coil protein SlyX
MAETNVKFLKENNLYDAHKQFMRMVEGYGIYKPIEEDGNDEDANGGTDPMGGSPDSGNGPMGVDNTMGGQDPMSGTPDGNAAPMGGGPDNGTDPMGGEPDPSSMDMGSGPMDSMPEPSPMDMSGDEGDDEDVIDVDDLTKAQEKTNDKVNSVGRDLGTVDKRIEKLLGALESMQSTIDKNNAQIEDLKNEFQKRNPTQTEKLNLRSLDSYPFNIRPTDYWAEKNANSNYDAYSDNNKSTTQEYTITNDDVDYVDDDIAKTFSIPDDDIQDFNKIFNM